MTEWNKLPQGLREEKSVSIFKRRVRRLVTDERDWDPGD